MSASGQQWFCSTWATFSPSPDLHGILVVAVDLDHVTPAAWLLDADERARSERLRSPVHQRHFLAAHTVLRQVLGACLGLDPGGIRVARSEHGKPLLSDHPLNFNLSHSGARALIAVSGHGRVGIDLEHRQHLGSADAIAERMLAPTERASWLALPTFERPAALLRAWTRKEALLKAIGRGLPAGMDRVVLDEDPLRVVGDHAALPDLTGLHLIDLMVGADHAAALAADAPVTALTLQRWSDQMPA
jgi:4'-phosphopantetheinyl transferase